MPAPRFENPRALALIFILLLVSFVVLTDTISIDYSRSRAAELLNLLNPGFENPITTTPPAVLRGCAQASYIGRNSLYVASGLNALQFKGTDDCSTANSYAYYKLEDTNITITPYTTLEYKISPRDTFGKNVGLDLQICCNEAGQTFYLRDKGIYSSDAILMHPAFQASHPNFQPCCPRSGFATISTSLGSLWGKTIKQVLVAYDDADPVQQGSFDARLDDIRIYENVTPRTFSLKNNITTNPKTVGSGIYISKAPGGSVQVSTTKQPAGVEGIVVDGPIITNIFLKDLQGNNIPKSNVWWNIDFVRSTVDGWAREYNLLGPAYNDGQVKQVLASSANPCARNPRELGDFDCSGGVSITDGVGVLRCAAGLDSGLNICSGGTVDQDTMTGGDIDCDGKITVTDGVNVLRKVAGLSVAGCPPPPPPPVSLVNPSLSPIYYRLSEDQNDPASTIQLWRPNRDYYFTLYGNWTNRISGWEANNGGLMTDQAGSAIAFKWKGERLRMVVRTGSGTRGFRGTYKYGNTGETGPIQPQLPPASGNDFQEIDLANLPYGDHEFTLYSTEDTQGGTGSGILWVGGFVVYGDHTTSPPPTSGNLGGGLRVGSPRYVGAGSPLPTHLFQVTTSAVPGVNIGALSAVPGGASSSGNTRQSLAAGQKIFWDSIVGGVGPYTFSIVSDDPADDPNNGFANKYDVLVHACVNCFDHPAGEYVRNPNYSDSGWFSNARLDIGSTISPFTDVSVVVVPKGGGINDKVIALSIPNFQNRISSLFARLINNVQSYTLYFKNLISPSSARAALTGYRWVGCQTAPFTLLTTTINSTQQVDAEYARGEWNKIKPNIIPQLLTLGFADNPSLGDSMNSVSYIPKDYIVYAQDSNPITLELFNAAAIAMYRVSGNKMLETDIYLREGYSTSNNFFFNAIEHEFGHVLGLEHSSTGSVMYSSNRDDRKYYPNDEERAALQDIYSECY
jgi:hypothetical protein